MSTKELRFYIAYITENGLVPEFHEWCRQFKDVKDEDTNKLVKLFYEEREMNHDQEN